MENRDARPIGISIHAEIVDRFSYASFENYIPILLSLKVENTTATSFEKLNLTLECSPKLIETRHWRIERLLPHSTYVLNERNLTLNPALLTSLSERMRAVLTLTLSKGSNLLAISRTHVYGLAKNEWGGLAQTPEMIVAFVQPNDPAIALLLKKAAEILEVSGEDPSLDGYSSRSRQRVWQMLNALWLAVGSLKIRYAEPPASFETHGQKVRSPSDVTQSGLATCLDACLLFSAAIEALGLHPLLVFTSGHVFCGAWLQPLRLPTLQTDDCSEIRKYIDLRELVVFETTLVTRRPLPTFSNAIQDAKNQLQPDGDQGFKTALDVTRARDLKIRPISIVETQSATPTPSPTAELELRLESPPNLPAFDFDVTEPTEAETPETRLGHWKRKLLDLTKRNRLINLKYSKTVIQLLCPFPAQLEDKLASAKKIKITSLAKLSQQQGQRDDRLYLERTGKDFTTQFAEEAFARQEIVCPLDEQDLQTSLIQIFRRSNTDLQEGGANTLFLALGLLKWKASPEEQRRYLAPLILVPVVLLRKNVAAKFRLTRHDDEPVFNLTLLEMLKTDFGVEIPELKGDLPRDNSGIDVRGIWDLVRMGIRDLQGFEVVEQTVLGNFSFAKYLMWKDLADRTDHLKQSPLVKHLIECPQEGFTHSASFSQAKELDQTLDPRDLFLPLPADSAQILAVQASANQGDFILEGPPGTGKSQTIANIIAHNLGIGRRVLFVSEKMAALDVVYRRLKEIGLGDFCLELHSAKANKKEVLNQLRWAFDSSESDPQTDWFLEAEKLKKLRDQLNHLVAELHRPHSSGISPFAAMARTIRWGPVHRFRLSWPGAMENLPIQTVQDYENCCKLAKELSLCFKNVQTVNSQVFRTHLTQPNWSKAWEKAFLGTVARLANACIQVRETAKVLCKRLGLPGAPQLLEQIQGLAQIAKAFPTAACHSLAFCLEPRDRALLPTFEKALNYLEDYRKRKSQLSLQYQDEPIFNHLLPWWNNQLHQADQSFWLVEAWIKRRIRKQIRTLFGLPKTSDPILDLPQLVSLRELRLSIDSLAKSFPEELPWNDLETQLDQGRAVIQACNWIQQGLSQFSQNSENLGALQLAMKKLLSEGQGLLVDTAAVGKAGHRFIQAHSEFEEAWALYKQEAGQLENLAQDLTSLEWDLREILRYQPYLHAWCLWTQTCQECHQVGLSDLIPALESGALTEETIVGEFKTGYASWLADHLLDEREVLRQFSGLKHEEVIREFRKLDQRCAVLSAQFIAAQIRSSIPRLNPLRLPKGYSVLFRELKKKARHKPVRKLISEMGRTLTTLTPCLLMSPLSISQYLSPEETLFDLVIFDEASQITTWDAIGSIARGRNVIIVGDPKQMPPSNFFGKSQSSEADDSEDLFEEDLESILDEAMVANVKTHRLTGHYRSRNESLITFSNLRYYNSQLVTFPSCQTRDSAVSLVRTTGLYQRGKTRTNPDEAKALVKDLLNRVQDPKYRELSFGIVAMNSEQQRLIEDLLESERNKNPLLEKFFAQDALEPIFVKNLETVQGDQRDVIFLSVGYAPDTPGAKTMSMNFGPLNKPGGERRLNVAITRATTEMVVYCSFSPSLIDLRRTSAEAVRDLKHYLEFAEKGLAALAETTDIVSTVASYDSDFEAAVASDLRKRGWQVHSQVGVSKYRIDLGIFHPDLPGKFLAGIECDGASYHSAPTARDRDRLRHSILENLGWNLIRIWSTDYFLNRKETLDRVDQKLRSLYEQDTLQRDADANAVGHNAEVLCDVPQTNSSSAAFQKSTTHPPPVNSSNEPTKNTKITLLSKADPNFVAPLLEWVDTFGPVTFNHLCQRAKSHFHLSEGIAEIRSLVKNTLGKQRQVTLLKKFPPVIWPVNSIPRIFLNFRGFSLHGEKRTWSQVPINEKFGLVHQALKDHPDLIAFHAIAIKLGLKNPTSPEIAAKLQPLFQAYLELKTANLLPD